MNEFGKRILYPALAVLLAVLISSGLAGADQSEVDPLDGFDGSNGQMVEEESGGEEFYPNPHLPMGLPVDLLFSGHGFAIRGNESYPLRLKVEVLLPVPPEQIRDLVASNRSLKEIREDIGENAGQEVHRGSLVFERSPYVAINILALPASNNSTLLQADLADLDSESGDWAILGRINLTVSTTVEGAIGRGALQIDRPPHEGRYSVLLNMDPSREDNRRSRSPSSGPQL